MRERINSKQNDVNAENAEKFSQTFKLLVSGNSIDLGLEVSEHLDNGYELYGNTFMSPHAFCQAVVLKYKKQENN